MHLKIEKTRRSKTLLCRRCNRQMAFYSRDRVGWFTRCPDCKEEILATPVRNADGDVLDGYHIEVGLSFRDWLAYQTNRDDPIGDLALEAQEDERFPTSGTLYTYMEYMAEQAGGYLQPKEKLALAQAWITWALEETYSWEEAVREVTANIPEGLAGPRKRNTEEERDDPDPYPGKYEPMCFLESLYVPLPVEMCHKLHKKSSDC